MKTYRLKRIIVNAGGIVTPERIKIAKKALLAKAAEEIGGKVEGNTIVTKKNIQGDIYFLDGRRCAGEFSEIPRIKKEG